MYARARERTRKPKRGVTLPESGGPTYRNIEGTVGSPYTNVVALTVGLRIVSRNRHFEQIMDPGPLEDPCREAAATQ